MGMCKGCKEVYSSLYMVDGFCEECLSSENIDLMKKKEDYHKNNEKSVPIKYIFIALIFCIIFIFELSLIFTGNTIATSSHWGWTINEPFMQWVTLIISGYAIFHYLFKVDDEC